MRDASAALMLEGATTMTWADRLAEHNGRIDTREIVAAALRWHTARERRMEIGAQKRLADAVPGTSGLSQQVRLSPMVTEAKRLERAALRILAKACVAHRCNLCKADDAHMVIEASLVAGPCE
jgi:HD superfamily phosphodiesterase